MANFLDIGGVKPETLRIILQNAKTMKDARKGLPKGAYDKEKYLDGYVAALVFEKPSTRTRVSFDIGARQMGGQTITLNGGETQLGRGETIADTARVLSRFVDLIMLRTFAHEALLEMAEFASVPIINGLTDLTHPCQIMADIMTFEEHRGSIKGKTVLWAGDLNNVCTSFMQAASAFQFRLIISGPQDPHQKNSWSKDAFAGGERIVFQPDIKTAVKEADLVVTDTWSSMHEEGGEVRKALMRPYQVNEELMKCAKSEALFMHCLPAHRGEEVTSAVMDGAQSVVFDEAENRLHVQKAIMRWCLGK